MVDAAADGGGGTGGDAGPAGAVVAAVDGSAAAHGAARWAALEARVHGAPLVIGSAVGLSGPGGAEVRAAVAAQGRAAVRRAEAAAREVLGDGAVVRAGVWDGSPVPAIEQAAAAADLVVLGDRGLGESPASTAGSVTMALIARVPQPVAVIRGWGGGETSLGAGPVVVGVDGSPGCAGALEYAVGEARARGADLRVVHAFSDVPMTRWGGGRPDLAAVTGHGEELIGGMLGRLRGEHGDVPIRTEVVYDRPVRHLLALADEAQLLVVGHRGRGGFQGMMVGSTSRALLHTAPCPLVVVRDDHRGPADGGRLSAG